MLFRSAVEAFLESGAQADCGFRSASVPGPRRVPAVHGPGKKPRSCPPLPRLVELVLDNLDGILPGVVDAQAELLSAVLLTIDMNGFF